MEGLNIDYKAAEKLLKEHGSVKLALDAGRA